MKQIPYDIKIFFEDIGFGIVSTSDGEGQPHVAVKGIYDIKEEGEVYLVDVYRQKTLKNIQCNPRISVAAVDEHRFTGYAFEGEAEILYLDEGVPAEIESSWKAAVSKRITSRVIKNLKGEKGHNMHPEAQLPHPQYIIKLTVTRIVDLTPKHIKNTEQDEK